MKVQYLKYIALLIGFFSIMYAKVKYQQRTRAYLDKSTPYSKEEHRILYMGYGFCILAIILVVLFN